MKILVDKMPQKPQDCPYSRYAGNEIGDTWYSCLIKGIVCVVNESDCPVFTAIPRCRECKYSSEPKQVSRLELYSNNYDVCFCEKEQKIVCGTHFCSYGERSDT